MPVSQRVVSVWGGGRPSAACSMTCGQRFGSLSGQPTKKLAQGGPKRPDRPREAKRSTEGQRGREANRGPGRPKEGQGGPERSGAAAGGPGASPFAFPKMYRTNKMAANQADSTKPKKASGQGYYSIRDATKAPCAAPGPWPRRRRRGARWTKAPPPNFRVLGLRFKKIN